MQNVVVGTCMGSSMVILLSLKLFFFQDPIKTFKVYSTIVHDVLCHHANWSPKYYISLRDVFTHQYRLFFGNIPSNFSHQKLYLQFGTMSIKISSFLKRYPPVEGHPWAGSLKYSIWKSGKVLVSLHVRSPLVDLTNPGSEILWWPLKKIPRAFLLSLVFGIRNNLHSETRLHYLKFVLPMHCPAL